ncbi:MAG TPA: cytochrome c oxidase assembly factor Coa1 family protein [Rhizomicrobium sp.]|nr:cytochrome c oxidase assembly factor Coa1 family protein [Rhizomicrobium sp.]
MTDTAPTTPGPLPPAPRERHGCLYGCLIAAGIFLVVLIGGFSWMGWYFYSGFKNNATLKSVVVELNNNQVARSVLGDNIEITSLSSSNFSADLSTGKTESYVAHVKGSKGEGTLSISAETPPRGQTHITKLSLIGPDGREYDLLSGAGGSRSPPGSI